MAKSTSTAITADEAATIAACSTSKIRKRLVPTIVERFHVRYRGEVIRYYYSRRDAERLRDGLPIRRRKHPDPDAAAVASARGQGASAMREIGKRVVDSGETLTVEIPEGTPSCCQRHAANHVRHVGTGYDSVLQMRRDAKGFSSADAGYSALRRRMDREVQAALTAAGKWPDVTDCSPKKIDINPRT